MRSAIVKSISVFVLACIACVVGYLFLLSVLARGSTKSWPSVVPALILALALLAVNARFLRADGLHLESLGFDRAPRRAIHFAMAFLAGGALVVLWACALAVVTGAHWHVQSGFDWVAAGAVAAFYLFNNAAEELAYRGWLFLRLESAFGAPVAVIAPTVVFAVAHIQGGVPWPSAVAGVMTTGFVFALLFQRTSDLPLVLGFHVGTNLLQELLGLRIGAATIVAPRFPAAITNAQGYTVLACIAALNGILALALVWSIRARRISVSSEPLT